MSPNISPPLCTGPRCEHGGPDFVITSGPFVLLAPELRFSDGADGAVFMQSSFNCSSGTGDGAPDIRH